MKYPLYCECGKAYQVAATAAGTAFPCGCGRPVEVPKLSTLRASVGYAATPEDYQLFLAIQGGRLPDVDCALCESPTGHVRNLVVTCQISYEVEPKVFLSDTLTQFARFINWLSRNEGRPPPEIVREFVLPLRVCKECNLDLEDEKSVRAALCREPMYAALFRRYTDSRIRDM